MSIHLLPFIPLQLDISFYGTFLSWMIVVQRYECSMLIESSPKLSMWCISMESVTSNCVTRLNDNANLSMTKDAYVKKAAAAMAQNCGIAYLLSYWGKAASNILFCLLKSYAVNGRFLLHVFVFVSNCFNLHFNGKQSLVLSGLSLTDTVDLFPWSSIPRVTEFLHFITDSTLNSSKPLLLDS